MAISNILSKYKAIIAATMPAIAVIILAQNNSFFGDKIILLGNKISFTILVLTARSPHELLIKFG